MKKILILTLFSFLGFEKDPVCEIDMNNAGKQIYDLDEATCFIVLKLNKSQSYLSLIRKALVTEEKYMMKIGLISENPDNDINSESVGEFDLNELVNYAINQEKVDLSKADLIEIYDTEVEYLKFIGVVSE